MPSVMKTGLLVLSSSLLLAACTGSGGGIVIQGSDTEVQLVSTLVEAFAKTHPDASISVAGGGSAVGIAALINGESDITNASRQMKKEELEQARANNLDPQEYILARDGLSVIVHPDNTIATISLDQLGAIFRGDVTNWKDVGGTDAPIALYGRQSTSGTFGFFRDTVVKGDYASSMRQMEGSQAIVDAVQADRNGVGYVGVGYIKDAAGTAKTGINIVPVSATVGSVAYSPLDKNAVEQELYPIARRIYQYLPMPPMKGSLIEAFLQFESSPEGQRIIEESGFYSLITSDKQQNAAFFGKAR